MRAGEANVLMVSTVHEWLGTADGRPARHGPWRLRSDKLSRVVKSTIDLYALAVPGMHRTGPGERGGARGGRRTVATAKGASMQITVPGKGLT